ncbi:unnamed protein product [Adineta steineri]|uniref:G-protein coupled receptors family 1 profile domain-containing protein n=1 Tax=Adineta steineri TaxID=433720 RepID=A0A815FVA3_9BILA|nr:unnamed protein product [Adineta steineri]
MSSNNNTSISLAIIQLQTAFRYSSLILGFILLIGGVLGNILNIILFIKVGNYKNNACSLYMFIRTFLDLYILLTGLTTRILTTGFQMDFTLMNRIWCKTRSGFLDITIISTYTLICLQAIDAFMCSSPSVVVRQKSNIRIARYLVIGTLCFWCIHEIPYFIFQDLVIIGGTPMCLTTNTIYAQYHIYVVSLGIVTISPITMISIFGFLTVRHMKTIAVTRTLSSLTRQTISMVLFQIFAVLVFNGPFTAWTIYSYAQYHIYVVSLGIVTISPITMISIFGFLTVRHMKTIAVTRTLSSLTRQTISMVLFQIFAVLVFNGPFTAWTIYSLSTTNAVKDTYRRTVEQLITSFAANYAYGPYASSFYCYCLSKRFRNQLLASLKELVCGTHTNQVFPNTQRSGTRT